VLQTYHLISFPGAAAALLSYVSRMCNNRREKGQCDHIDTFNVFDQLQQPEIISRPDLNLAGSRAVH
jgi:hypothetical protein